MNSTGRLSFDLVDCDGELFLIECNPLSTHPGATLSMVEPGTEVQLDFAVVA